MFLEKKLNRAREDRATGVAVRKDACQPTERALTGEEGRSAGKLGFLAKSLRRRETGVECGTNRLLHELMLQASVRPVGLGEDEDQQDTMNACRPEKARTELLPPL